MNLAPLESRTQQKEALFAVLSPAEYGVFFPHVALAEVIGEVPQSFAYRNLVRGVGKRLEREAQRVLVSERGQGYRIARPNEHVRISDNRALRGRRQVARAVQVLQATPVQSLTPEERRRHEAYLTIMHAQADALRGIKRQVERAHETVSDLVQARLAEAEARIAALEGPH